MIFNASDFSLAQPGVMLNRPRPVQIASRGRVALERINEETVLTHAKQGPTTVRPESLAHESHYTIIPTDQSTLSPRLAN